MRGSKLSPALSLALCLVNCAALGEDDLPKSFLNPPDSARPGVYWYFMDGNLSRNGMTRDLESMKAAGLGHLVFLEVDIGVPRGPVGFLSEQWQDLFVHAVRESERLGIEIMLGSGPGWTGSGGPWVKPEQSMQHLVASKTEAQGPAKFEGRLPVARPRQPFFGDVPPKMRAEWENFFSNVAVLAFPTPPVPTIIPEIDEKALVYRAPFSSQPNVKPRIEAPADYPTDPPGSTIPLDQVLDLTEKLNPDGTLDWQVPMGKWTVLRFVSRNNGASTRPAPDPAIGFECDKFDSTALDAHFDEYVGRLLNKVGTRQRSQGWTMLHIDSWEMGAQNWSPKLRDEFRRRRGYDPLPFYPVYVGYVVGSREHSERFLWDLRATAQELVIENHAEHLKQLGRKHGFTLSIEPYDMNPANDFDLGAVADMPMCEFWSLGFDTAYSCHQSASIAHVMGRQIVGAEAFTGAPGEDWKFYPGALKNQGDWAFATGINRLTYHTFAHKPDEGHPGMVMGPYGVHWDRGQTWWPMVRPYHRYIARCQHLLRQGRAVADTLYLMPEGAPNVFQPPASAFSGTSPLLDRRGYNFDGCSARALIKLAQVKAGQIVFPGGAAYRLLVLPNSETMTPELLSKIESLLKAGATVVGNPPRKSPSLLGFPDCDRELARQAESIWGSLRPPAGHASRAWGNGKLIWGQALSAADPSQSPPLTEVKREFYPHYDLTSAILRDAVVPEDFTSPGPLRYTHRCAEGRDIYFVANRSDQVVETSAVFRIDAGSPELWDPLNGQIRSLPEFTRAGDTTRIPLRFEPFESYFVVFPTKPRFIVSRSNGALSNFAQLTEVTTFNSAWDVSFDPTMGAPDRVRFEELSDWTRRPEAGLKHYSGIATYRTTFDLPPSCNPGGPRLYLDVGCVYVIARVRVNGADCGVAWTAPWRVDISDAVQAKNNTLEIKVANLWPNRMIGDAASSEPKYTQTTYRPFKPSDPLLPSGLIGPVRLMK